MDDFERIYGSSKGLPLFKMMASLIDHNIPLLGDAGLAHNLYACNGPPFGRPLSEAVEQALHFEMLQDVRYIYKQIERQYAAQLGPRVSLKGGPDVDMGGIHVVLYDADFVLDEEGPLEIDRELSNWEDCGLPQAASAYKHECGWDFTPGEAGIWLVSCIITDGIGGDDVMYYSGNLLGFLILYDRDDDGEYESLAHMWTAEAARRKGVATGLIQEARRRFPLKKVESPTEAGSAVLRVVWPEVL